MNDPLRGQPLKPERNIGPAAGLVALGIFVALAAILLAFFPAGAGHGWGAPFFISMPLLVILPVVLIRFRTGKRTGIAWDIGLVALAVASDYYLIDDAIDFRENIGRIHNEYLVPGVHRSVFPMFLLWLGIWLFWQWLAIRTLVRHFLGRTPSAGRS